MVMRDDRIPGVWEMNVAKFRREYAAFKAYGRSKDLSPKTIQTYHQELRQFHRWFVGRYGEDAAITARRIREYMASRLDRGNTPGTVRGSITALRAFFGFLVLDEMIIPSENPMRLIEAPRMRQTEIRPLTPEQVRRLLNSFDKDNLLQYRNYVICLLILDTGLRIGEVVRLQTGDINFNDSSLGVDGKGRKHRKAYMGQKMTSILLDYIDNCRHWFANGHDTLFPPASWSPNTKMRPHTLSEIIRKKMDEADIPRANSSGHRLRHTFATNFIRAGGNILALQKLLGHSKLDMTRRYVMLMEDDLAKAHRRASPVDRMAL